MARLFPIIIILIMLFIGGMYMTLMFSQAETSTNAIANNSTLKTGSTLLNTVAGFASEQIVILAFLVFLILFVGVLLVLRGGD